MALNAQTDKRFSDSAAYYFTGKPCKNGHVAKRYKRSRGCVICIRERNLNWMNANRAAHIEKVLAVERASREKIRNKLGEHGVRLRSKEHNLLHTYKIRLADYDRMFAEQSGGCAICGSPPATSKSNNGYLDVDHDHVTGAVRGLLCHKCNQGMIAVDSTSDWLTKASSYVAKNRRA